MLPVEAIHDERSGRAGGKCAEGIRGNKKPELPGGNIKRTFEEFLQRHHDHKIHDVGEVDGCEGEQEKDFFSGHNLLPRKAVFLMPAITVRLVRRMTASAEERFIFFHFVGAIRFNYVDSSFHHQRAVWKRCNFCLSFHDF